MYIDNILHEGGASGREEKEMRCYEFLNKLDIKYSRVDHDRADTITACEEVEIVLGAKICKNLFLTNRQQTEFYLLLMPGEKPFFTKLLSKQIGKARLSFASPEHMESLLNITPGSVSVLGLMNDKEKKVHLLIDRDLLNDEYFGCHPCLNTSTLKFKTKDLIEKILPALSHKPRYVDLPWERPEE